MNAPASGLYNLGTGRAQTWLELMGALYSAVDRELEVRWVDTPEEIRDTYQYFTQADMTKLRDAGYTRAVLSRTGRGRGLRDTLFGHSRPVPLRCKERLSR